MINYLKSKGFVYTVKDTLNHKEFKRVSRAVNNDEELSTFSHSAIETLEVYELFLAKRNYQDSIIDGIIDGVMDEAELITATADIEEQERGYLITLSFTIKE
jgi:hypothetical protein